MRYSFSLLIPMYPVILIDQLSWLKNVIGGDFIVAMRLYTLLVFTFIDFKWNNCLRDARKEALAYIIKRIEDKRIEEIRFCLAFCSPEPQLQIVLFSIYS